MSKAISILNINKPLNDPKELTYETIIQDIETTIWFAFHDMFSQLSRCGS